MPRSLEDMKRDRGGMCHRCGMDIMSPEQKDHTYCNDCWDTMLAHSFERDDDDLCAQCGEDENYRPHDIYRRKIADRMYRIAGLG